MCNLCITVGSQDTISECSNQNIWQVLHLRLAPERYNVFMFTTRTLFSTLLLSASLFTYAANDTPAVKAPNTLLPAKNKPIVQYTFDLDNKANRNNAVDSVLVILDKYDRSGAGIVTKVFYPNARNQVVVENLPAGKYYAEIYVLGLYRNHFSAVISAAKKARKNKARLRLEFKDVYLPGNAHIPAEDLSLFAFSKLSGK